MLVPPLKLSWRSATALSAAVPSSDSLYGISANGRVTAIRTADGAQLWESAGTYLPGRLARQGSRLFAYRVNEGLVYIDDLGKSASERLSLSFLAAPTTAISGPVIDDRMLYLAVNSGLYATHQEQGLQYGGLLGDLVPHRVGLITNRALVVVNGKGIPTRYTAGSTSFDKAWTGANHGIDTPLAAHPFTIANNRLIIGIGPDTVAYDLSNGQVLWHVENLPARAFASDGAVIYCAAGSAAIWALRAADGQILWQRQYLYGTAIPTAFDLALADGHLYYGTTLQTNPDGAVLMAVNTADGSLAWLSRAAGLDWSGGIPVADGTRLYTYGASQTGQYIALPSAPRITLDRIEVAPRPLRGPASGFGQGSVSINLPVSATVSMATYREARGVGPQIVSRVNWSAGQHQATWSAGGNGGFSDENQFGYLLIDIEETNGPAYTQAAIIPVNTFPDILWHWARSSIETMLYRQFVNGYPDQTFKPDNLITRAESATVIAQTLKLDRPSPGFKSRFTDLGTHWARNYIIALEERGIVSGFVEPDGSYTFRPDLNMTRAEEARILVTAYAISPAPADFVTQFTDIAGHWAAPDIKALEYLKYVNGFREPNGTYTYRPEQNLTRAEICALVVRVRQLTR